MMLAIFMFNVCRFTLSLSIIFVLSSNGFQFDNVRNELLEAVYVADVAKVDHLLSLDPSILTSRPPILIDRTESQHGRTALMLCGYDPQEDDVAAIDSKCYQIAKMLHIAGANLSHVDNHGWNALSMAAVRGMTKFSEYLILNGNIDINSRDHSGMTPLMKAAAHGHASTCEMLIRLGANSSLSDINGMSALHFSVRLTSINESFLPSLEALLRCIVGHVDDSVDKDGRTPLMYSLIGRNNNYNAAKLLLQHGADPRKTDEYGVSAISMTDYGPLKELMAEYAASLVDREYAAWIEQTNLRFAAFLEVAEEDHEVSIDSSEF